MHSEFYDMPGEPVLLSDGSGWLLRCTQFEFGLIPPRPVDSWLPQDYAEQPDARWPVVYMHDGQNLFDPGLAFGGIDWGVDEAVLDLTVRGEIRGALVVGVWNSSQRWRDYLPAAYFHSPRAEASRTSLLAALGGEPLSDAYLRFLCTQLKPFVDAHFRTLPERASSVVMGSSMGGLVSLYALTEYPQVFGAAGCVSTHWSAGGDDLVDLLAARLPSPGGHRLYFDHGTQGLDSQYSPFQQRMDAHGSAAGYQHGRDWLSLQFDGADHNEAFWRERVTIPLRFLLAAAD